MTSLAQAYAECAHRARAHDENFPIGSWLLPRRLRRDLAAIYAFARLGDDLADEGNDPPAVRVAALDDLERRLLDAVADPERERHPVLLAVAHTIARYQLPVSSFQDLLIAFRRDAAGESWTFATFADLLDYCRYSANPVGRLVLGLFDHHDDARGVLADDVCTALQLTNCWQDVRSDFAERGRIYVPAEDLARFPGALDAIEAGRMTPGFRACLAFQIERTRRLFARGRGLADRVAGRLRREVGLFVAGGVTILDRIEACDYDVLTQRPRLGRGDLARLVWREVWR
jgi:squalene synthase HpnC